MSKTANQKAQYNIRREMRLRRDKTAALLMPYFMARVTELDDQHIEDCAIKAVKAADILLAELDRTRKDLKPGGEHNG